MPGEAVLYYFSRRLRTVRHIQNSDLLIRGLRRYASYSADRTKHTFYMKYTAMNGKDHLTDRPVRPKLRLGEIERLIRKHRIIVPPLARHTLIHMCEDGTFETAGNGPTRLGWLVYEDSFWRWARDMDAAGD